MVSDKFCIINLSRGLSETTQQSFLKNTRHYALLDHDWFTNYQQHSDYPPTGKVTSKVIAGRRRREEKNREEKGMIT